ncbi:GNAT family N-acetyltransferase [Ideonella sp.]|uniref:GNAT family N-acetyltransferase n=1 Tax=Ideonella sp. TaxID=1929293 RepID=UPI0035B4B554
MFRPADLRVDRGALFQLSVEYMLWVTQGIAAQGATTAPSLASVERHVAEGLDLLCGKQPPEGVFYLVEWGGAPVGTGGLRQITPGVAELKRIYVRPSHRGLRLGEAMLNRLIADARAFGCEKAVLDSAPFMPAAHRLYAAAGFTDCPPYPGSEAPRHLLDVWRFMERRL